MSTQHQPTWNDIRRAVSNIARESGEWAGIPMPVEGKRMVIHPSYPFADRFSEVFCPKDGAHVCRDEDMSDDVEMRNEFRSCKDGRMITIWRDHKRFFFIYSRRQNSGHMLLPTLSAARAWSFEAEIRAMETLRSHITAWAFECYFMTGMFLESSTKSGVTYLFRRLRPTVAITSRPDYKLGRSGEEPRILCTLCQHPIGYYDGSWAGALVPTDDVIAHLLLMRSDEHYYWKISNQHPAWAPESGL